ncbi:MAG: phosphotyrosine protein phosphatase [Pseudomonadota bacterium]
MTAEHLFAEEPGLDARSAGTARRDERAVTETLLDWADFIFAMEQRHIDRLRARFAPKLLADKTMCVLGVPDEFEYMEPILIERLRAAVLPLLR